MCRLVSEFGRVCERRKLRVNVGKSQKRDVVHRMNEGYRAWGELKSVLSNRGLGIKAKKCLVVVVIVVVVVVV